MRNTLKVLFLTAALAAAPVWAATVVDIPLDVQINNGHTWNTQTALSGAGNAIYPANNIDTQTFVAAGSNVPPGGTQELEGFVRHNILAGSGAGSWYYQYVDFALAQPLTDPAYAVDLTHPCARIDFDTRYFQDPNTNTNPYGDAPVFVRLYTYAADGNTYVGYRDYGIVYATQDPWNNPSYPDWTHVSVMVNEQPYTQGGVFNPARVNRVRFYGTDWSGAGQDFVDFKNLVITTDSVPPVIDPVEPNVEVGYPGVPYSHQLTFTGCDPAAVWSLPVGPAGAAISDAGLVTWTPGAGGTTANFTARVTADGGTFSEASWSVEVQAPSRLEIPLDAQINYGHTWNTQTPASAAGDAIYPAFNTDTQTFVAAGVNVPPGGTEELEGFLRHNMIGADNSWWYQYVDFALAQPLSDSSYAVNMSHPCTRLEFDTRYYQDPNTNTNPYGDAPVFVRLYTYAADGNAYVGYRDYSIVYATQPSWNNPSYPDWTHVVVMIHGQAYTEGGTFDPARVNRMRFYGTDWSGHGQDFVDFKNLVVDAEPTPPVVPPIDPNVDASYPGFPYTKQIIGITCDPVKAWTLPVAPGGATIDENGIVSGWTPGAGDVGNTVDFTARLTNSVSFAEVSWTVLVKTPPVLDGSNVHAPWGTLHGNIFSTQSSADPSLLFSNDWAGGAEVTWTADLSAYGGSAGERGGIVFDGAGNLYFKTEGGNLVSVTSAGAIRWGTASLGVGDATTPVVGDGGPTGRVYTITDTGVAAFIKSTGAQAWSTDLPGCNFAGDADGKLNPVLYNGWLFVVGAGKPTKNVYALNAADGEIVWIHSFTSTDGGDGWTAPKSAMTLVPDAFGAGVHGLYFNGWGTNVGNNDLHAIAMDTNTYSSLFKWSVRGGPAARSHVVYSAVTNKLYTANWGDNNANHIQATDPVTGAGYGARNPTNDGHGYADMCMLDFNGTDLIAAASGGLFYRYSDNGTTFDLTAYRMPAAYGEEWMYGGLYQTAAGESVVVAGSRGNPEQVYAFKPAADNVTTCADNDDAGVYIDNLVVSYGPTGTETVKLDVGGFEGYANGDLVGQGAGAGVTWVDNSDVPALGQVVDASAIGGGSGKALLLDVPGGCGDTQGVYAQFDAGLTGTKVKVAWDQYRADLTDNLWLSEGEGGWYAYQWDSDKSAHARHADNAVSLTEGMWEHIEYTFDLTALTVIVRVNGVASDPATLLPAENTIRGWSLTLEGTNADDNPASSERIFTYDTGLNTAGENFIRGLQMGPAAPGEKQKLYFFRGGAGELVALTYVTAIPADFNGDRKVNAADLELFEICAAGPNVPLTPQCLSKDLDADQDADSSDFAVWQRCYSGNELALPTCND